MKSNTAPLPPLPHSLLVSLRSSGCSLHASQSHSLPFFLFLSLSLLVMFLIKSSRSCFLLLLFYFFYFFEYTLMQFQQSFQLGAWLLAGLKHLRELSQHGIFAAYHDRGVIRNKVSRKSVCQINLDRIYARLNPIIWNRKAGVQWIFIWKRQKNCETGENKS